jgi:hypothetical protein
LSFTSSNEDIDDREVVEGDCLGVSVGDAAAVEGEESAVVEVTVLLRRLRWGIAVEAMIEVCIQDLDLESQRLIYSIDLGQVEFGLKVRM